MQQSITHLHHLNCKSMTPTRISQLEKHQPHSSCTFQHILITLIQSQTENSLSSTLIDEDSLFSASSLILRLDLLDSLAVVSDASQVLPEHVGAQREGSIQNGFNFKITLKIHEIRCGTHMLPNKILAHDENTHPHHPQTLSCFEIYDSMLTHIHTAIVTDVVQIADKCFSFQRSEFLFHFACVFVEKVVMGIPLRVDLHLLSRGFPMHSEQLIGEFSCFLVGMHGLSVSLQVESMLENGENVESYA